MFPEASAPDDKMSQPSSGGSSVTASHEDISTDPQCTNEKQASPIPENDENIKQQVNVGVGDKDVEGGQPSDTDADESCTAAAAAADAADAAAAEENPSVLDRVLSRTSTRMVPGPPPDGGWQAWIICAAVHIAIMNTWGMIGAFGTFQTYYTSDLGWSASSTSWIGSIQIFLLFFVGTFSGRLTDAGYYRALVSTGIVIQTVGTFTIAQSSTYWQYFLSQGVAVGVGGGLMFCPCMATLSTYFRRKRALAIGLAACGSATGGLVYPSIVRQMLSQVGFPWTIRTIGFLQTSTMLIATSIIKPRLPPRRGGPFFELAAFREAPYAFYSIGTFITYLGTYVAFFYVASFSRDIIGLSYESSLNLLLVMNGVGSVGRIIPNFLADRYGPLNLFVIAGIIAGIAGLCWAAVDNIPGLYVWSVAYGLAAGGIQSLFPAALTSLTTDLSKTGVRMGMIFTINSISVLIGPPISGAFITAAGGSYIGSEIFTGATLIVGTLLVGCARMALCRTNEKGWKAMV